MTSIYDDCLNNFACLTTHIDHKTPRQQLVLDSFPFEVVNRRNFKGICSYDGSSFRGWQGR